MQPIPFTSGHLGTGVVLGILVLVNFILIMVYVIGGMQSSLTTREFPAIKYKANVIEVINTNKTLTHDDSGSVVLFATTAGVSVTLPKPKLGVVYNFGLKTATVVGSGVYINTHDTGTDFYGALTLTDVDSAVGETNTYPATSGDSQIHLENSSPSIHPGTNFEILCDGTSWVVSGILVSKGTRKTPFS